MKLHHGSRGPLALHVGLCLTDDARAARDYAFANGGTGSVHAVEVPLSTLRVVASRAFAAGSTDATGDTRAELARLARRGVDVVTYQDESTGGRVHTTWRLVSARAVAAITAY